MAIVYKASNIMNGKIYIGQTIRSLEQRKSAHASSAKQGSNLRFHQAIRKYGIDLFDFQILFESDLESVRKKEEEFILQFDSTNFEKGYNARPGGCGGFIIPEHKIKSWRAQLGRPASQNGKWCGYTDDELVSLACKYIIENNFNYVPGFASIQKAIPKFPNIQKRSCRFGGGGTKELIRLISEKLNLPPNPYFRTPQYKKNQSNAAKGWLWVTDGYSNLRIKQTETPPPGFKRGRNVKN
jgi:hypothetical protein